MKCEKNRNKSIYGDLRGKEKGMTNYLYQESAVLFTCIYVCERERKREGKIVINVVA